LLSKQQKVKKIREKKFISGGYLPAIALEVTSRDAANSLSISSSHSVDIESAITTTTTRTKTMPRMARQRAQNNFSVGFIGV
jgi:hypothetical protein